MIEIKQIRSNPDESFKSLSTRGVTRDEFDRLLELDRRWRDALISQEESRAKVKELSRRYGQANRAGDTDLANSLGSQSKKASTSEAEATKALEALDSERRDLLLRIPNFPDPNAPVGTGEQDNQTEFTY